MTTVGKDWELFTDWCAAAGHPTVPVTIEAVTEFLTFVTGRPSTKARLVRSIRAAARAARANILLNPPTASTTVRAGEEWATVRQALAQLPTTRFPVGLRGRRDGWILVTLGELQLTRRQARALQSIDVELAGTLVRVAGHELEQAEDPRECPRCAATRWLRIADAATAGRREDVRDALYQEPDGTHDCATPVPADALRPSTTLMPAIDRHGWVTGGRPMSQNAVSTVMRLRQVAGERPDEYTVRRAGGRFMDYTSAELADAYDDIDKQLADLLARTEDVLGEGDSLAVEVDELSGGSRASLDLSPGRA